VGRLSCFFFFQAEDGIRDKLVTGVQTCALPICDCLLRWTTPANNPQFVLNLPPGTRETYEKAIASIPEDKRIWWRAHKVEEGETLPSLARKYRISRVALAESNHLDTNSPILAGARLVIPMAPKSEATLARVRERGPRRAVRYPIPPRDTLELIADRLDVP